MLTPPTTAASSAGSAASARAARSSATREEEQAVSTVCAGPRRSKTLPIRLARIDSALPVMKKRSAAEGSARRSSA